MVRKKTSKPEVVIEAPAEPSTAMVAGAVLGGEPERDWSRYQRDIFDEVQNGTGHLVVQAVAGSGKSTTIMEALKLIPKGKSAILMAFNKNIANELKARAPAGVEVKTLHSHGLATISQAWKLVKAKDMEEFKQNDKRRTAQMMAACGAPGAYSLNEWATEFYRLRDLIGKCKSLLATTPELVARVQEDYRLLVGRNGRAASWEFIEPIGENWPPDRRPVALGPNLVAHWVLAAMRFSVTQPADGIISFNDMVFAPAVLPKVIPRQYDFVFVDETQDMTAAQLKLVMKTVKPETGRIVIIGDMYQSIYGFSGADSGGMERMERELKAKRLPLSVSYRVPQCSAREAQKLVKDFSVPTSSPEGTCSVVSARRMATDWDNGDFVITRANYVIHSLVMLAIAGGKYPLAIGGEDVAKQIRTIITKSMRKTPSITTPKTLMRTANALVEGAIKDAMQAEKKRRQSWSKKLQLDDDELAEITEVVLLENTLAALDMLSKRFNTLSELIAFVDSISIPEEVVDGMSDEDKRRMTKGRLVISSVHRIKGAEANRTWVLEETFKYGLGGFKRPTTEISPREAQEEKNLWYVAVTRVKNEPNKPGQLYYVRAIKEILGGVPERLER